MRKKLCVIILIFLKQVLKYKCQSFHIDHINNRQMILPRMNLKKEWCGI